MLSTAMIGLLMAATVPSELQARGDEAGAVYVQCLFSVVRESGAAHLSQSAFEQRLAASCRREESAYRALAVRIMKARGDPAPEQSIDRLNREMRQGMIDDYRTLPEKQRLLEEMSALCAANPQECR
jgi:hypothetical protein